MITKEAIKWLNEAEILDLTSGNTKDKQAIDAAIEALEKQIPQKYSKVLDYLGRERPECGNCGEVIEDGMWDYCPWCGQRIGGER